MSTRRAQAKRGTHRTQQAPIYYEKTTGQPARCCPKAVSAAKSRSFRRFENLALIGGGDG
jgi:hypothetical protein